LILFFCTTLRVIQNGEFGGILRASHSSFLHASTVAAQNAALTVAEKDGRGTTLNHRLSGSCASRRKNRFAERSLYKLVTAANAD
jgi:hypothetical protein